MRALRKHRKRQAKEILKAGEKYDREKDLVFTNTVGRLLDPGKARRLFYKALKKAGLPKIRLYDARHSHATHLLREGEHPKKVADRLGHASTKMTMDVYSHVLPSMQEEVVETLNQSFARVATG